jgi:NitT/TauT family transport system substrate-binding protein
MSSFPATLSRYARRFSVAALLGAFFVGATGCNLQGGGSGAGDGASPAKAAANTVRVGFFPNVTHAVALVGTGRGTFQNALGPGVSVEEKTFNAGPAEIEALFAGAIDIGYLGPGPAVNGYLKSGGQALKIVAGASSGGAGLVARAGSGITGVAGLAGKHVAIPQVGGTQDISLRHALTEAGLKTTAKGGDVDVVQYAPADVETQMQRGGVDAAWLPEPWVARLEKAGIATLVLDERDHWPGRKFSTTVVVVRSEFLRDHADLVAKFLAAHTETVAWINAHPDDARKVVGDRIAAITKKPLPDEVLKAALARTDITDDPLAESVLTFADWSKDLGYLKEGRSALGGLIDTTALDAARKKRTAAAAAVQK